MSLGRFVALSLDEARARLAGQPGAFFLRDESRSFLGAFPVAVSESVDPEPEFRIELGLGRFPRWVGLLPYEAFRGDERAHPRGAPDARPEPLLTRCLWHRYEAVVIAEENGELRVEGETPDAVERLVQALDAAPQVASAPEPDALPLLSWREPPEDGALHRVRVERALELIGRGQLYQVSLARRFTFESSASAFALLEALGRRADVPYAAALDWGDLSVVSASPELFLHVESNGNVHTCPIKGTRPRASSPTRDLELRLELDASEKERAELAMVIDLERNDLGKLAETGSVQVTALPHVVTHPTVHHREARVSAVLRQGVSRAELLTTMLPSGSVTGAPKIRAMDLIAELEPHRRGLYTGALGYLAQDGTLRLSMAIRVLVRRGTETHYFSGGGIVADSRAEEEVEETLWKASHLGALLGDSAENWARPRQPG